MLDESAYWRPAVLACFMAVLSGCTSFATPRSASVQPGVHMLVQGSVSTPPGDGAAWFWALDCASNCNHAIGAAEFNLTYGFLPEDGLGFSFGGGVNGTESYLEGYKQFRGGVQNPWGFGARLGLPLYPWHEHRIFLRYDKILESGNRLLYNPSVIIHSGNSPSGMQPGTFVGLTQSVGFQRRGPGSQVTSALTLVLGRGRRNEFGTFGSAFLVGSVSVVF